MDRKTFLKGCATGFCACAAAPALAGEPPKQEDWRIGFIKRRHAKLLAALSERAEGDALAASISEMGAFCSEEDEKEGPTKPGDIDAFAARYAKWGFSLTRDDANKTYTLSYDPKGDCSCTFNSLAAKTPGVMCNCSVGWVRHKWTILLGKEPKVVLKEAVLQGGKLCKFEITAA